MSAKPSQILRFSASSFLDTPKKYPKTARVQLTNPADETIRPKISRTFFQLRKCLSLHAIGREYNEPLIIVLDTFYGKFWRYGTRLFCRFVRGLRKLIVENWQFLYSMRPLEHKSYRLLEFQDTFKRSEISYEFYVTNFFKAISKCYSLQKIVQKPPDFGLFQSSSKNLNRQLRKYPKLRYLDYQAYWTPENINTKILPIVLRRAQNLQTLGLVLYVVNEAHIAYSALVRILDEHPKLQELKINHAGLDDSFEVEQLLNHPTLSGMKSLSFKIEPVNSKIPNTIVEIVKSPKNLALFNFECGFVEEVSTVQLFNALKMHKGLISFGFSIKCIKLTNSTLAYLEDTINNMSNLRILKLKFKGSYVLNDRSTKLSDEGMKYVANGISKLSELEYIDIDLEHDCRNPFSDITANYLLKAISNLKKVSNLRINFSQNPFISLKGAGFLRSLVSSLPNLKNVEIDIRGCKGILSFAIHGLKEAMEKVPIYKLQHS